MYRKLGEQQIAAIEQMKKNLTELYPTARPELINILFECIDLHARKNNDYNGDMDLYRATGIVGRFCDIWRKVIRMFNAIVLKTNMVVDENLIETGKDSIVYHALLVEELNVEKNKKTINNN